MRQTQRNQVRLLMNVVDRFSSVLRLHLGMGSRAASKVTFRDGDGKQQPRSSTHPTESEQRSSNFSASAPANHPNQLSGLKKKDQINPFKFSSDVDFCALSQMDKREKAQVKSSDDGSTSALFPLHRNANECKIFEFMRNYPKLNS